MTPRASGAGVRPVAVVGVPSSAGARRGGQEGGPAALRAAGLITALRELGAEVSDRGDLPAAVFRPDLDNPRARNLEPVCRVAAAVAAQVEAVDRDGAFPLVLGGDCSIAVGVLAGLLARGPDVGLLYFDSDLDLNTPDTTLSGVFDGMVIAHLLGMGSSELSGIGPRKPLLDESNLVFFSYNERDGGIDPPELALLERSPALRFPVETVRDDPAAAAHEALSFLEERVERILVHFDVDVTDTPAVDVPHPNGLPLDGASTALEIFTASPRCAGLVCTELNPDLDPEGSAAREFADRLARAAARVP